ncbi:MAG TPA: hypothetical protein VLL52_17695 [Anaerolineae bacterium]|nr:hypothetical protein [Anaerolineae bacterium]
MKLKDNITPNINVGLFGHFTYCYEYLFDDILDLVEAEMNNEVYVKEVGQGDAKYSLCKFHFDTYLVYLHYTMFQIGPWEFRPIVAIRNQIDGMLINLGERGADLDWIQKYPNSTNYFQTMLREAEKHDGPTIYAVHGITDKKEMEILRDLLEIPPSGEMMGYTTGDDSRLREIVMRIVMLSQK